MDLEFRCEPLSNPLDLMDMLGEISTSSGVTKFEFVAYIPGAEYDFTESLATRKFDLDSMRRVELDNLASDLVRHIYKPDELEEKLKRVVVGLVSHVPGGHLPQIDFSCVSSEEEVYDFVRDLRLRGYVLLTGNGYHFQGSEIMEPDRWRELLNNLRGYEIVDLDWISECNDSGYSVLRVTSDAYEKPYVPKVIARLDKVLRYKGQLELPL